MRRSSRVSAYRRELNTYKAAETRAAYHSRRRANPQAWVECRRESQAMVPCPTTSLMWRSGARRSTETASRRQRSSFGAAKVCIGGVSPQKVPFSPCRPTAHSAQRQASGEAHHGSRFFAKLAACAHPAQRCLTPRSSRAPTACHAGPAGGTRYIFAIRARASHRWCRLNSNVRHRELVMRSAFNTARPSGLASSTQMRASAGRNVTLVARSHRRSAVAGQARVSAGLMHTGALTLRASRLRPQRVSAPLRTCMPLSGLSSQGSALPNPSLKLSTNGGPRGPGRRYPVHSRQPGPRVPPSVPA